MIYAIVSEPMSEARMRTRAITNLCQYKTFVCTGAAFPISR